MSNYSEVYSKLNRAQKLAVDTIEGPLLVVAGPGTGKTQILSARVANILKNTDTLPQNVLCLTFTETGAANMRQRLTRFIGAAAYDVNIGTYHAFGGDLLQTYPEYFGATGLQSPVDEIGQYQIISSIVDELAFSNPLKQTQHHINDVISTISELKRALVTPDDLIQLAKQNNAFIQAASVISKSSLAKLTTTASFKVAFPAFSDLLIGLSSLNTTEPVTSFASMYELASTSLAKALEQAESSGKTTAITKWKNDWLTKNESNEFEFAGSLQNDRMTALADVLKKYATTLEKNGLYDFDDMILRSIVALESNTDFKYSLQERYQYILLDEFQDTNAAQAKLITLLTDNPVNEGRPNIMAVGDDDQAIYAFQGAQYSNMLDFYHQYRDTAVIHLTDNYRSDGAILETAHNIADQIEQRLHHQFDGVTKQLIAKNMFNDTKTSFTEYMSQPAEHESAASQIAKLIEKGTSPSEIAILAPRHKYLEPLVLYLNQYDIPVKYDKRENILESSVITQVISMSRLTKALALGDESLAKALWPEVLSFEFWQLPITVIWKLSWGIQSSKSSWTESVLDNEYTRQIGLLFLALASKFHTETCEIMLDYIIGSQSVNTNEADIPEVLSPLRSYYANDSMQANHPEQFYEMLSHLTVLRQKVRERNINEQKPLQLQAVLELVDLYKFAGQRMVDTSPYSQAADAVQLMTVYKAKGLEFEHVFVIDCLDDVWGNSSRSSSNRITLPINIQPIRKSGTTEDERLRILFVAITRAKKGLYFSNYSQSYTGKVTKPLKYLHIQEQPDSTKICAVLPEKSRVVSYDGTSRPRLEVLLMSWQHRHIENTSNATLRDLLTSRLDTYQLSPTHLNQFTDVVYGGPNQFFINTILRFPQAPSTSSTFGSAIHGALDWLQRETNKQATVPTEADLVGTFKHILSKSNLTKNTYQTLEERGTIALSAYYHKIKSTVKPGNIPEYNFKNEGVFLDTVHMAGKIDLLEINEANKTICVVDYKTGSSFTKWKADSKLHKYRQQLLAYKILVEGSHRFKGYTVTQGRLEFVEPDGQGKLYALELTMTELDEEIARLKLLISAMWHHVKALEFPSIESYSKDLKGIQAFEDALLAK